MKLLWHSNSPWCGTGYGNQTALFVPRLAAAGHDIAISAFYGLNGSPLAWEGLRIYPGGNHPYGNDVLLHHAVNHFGGSLDDGLIVTLVDAWVLNAGELSRANVACWTPIDHEPAPPAVLEVLHGAQATPIAMSRHGERMLTQGGLEPVYVPHGVNTSLYRPIDRGEARELVGLPEDAFVVGMVAANKGYPPRKCFPQAIEAFARLREKHGNALLYLHTEPHGIIGGINLPAIVNGCGLPAESVRFCDPYRYLLGYPAEYMAAAYSAMDVLLNPAMGEGFGIPIVEAQACGTPVIVTDWTAMIEVGEVGWHVDGQRVFTDQGAWQKTPYVADIAAALEDAYERAHRLRQRAREFALGYDADLVMAEHWAPALERIEAKIGAAPAVEPVSEPVAA